MPEKNSPESTEKNDTYVLPLGEDMEITSEEEYSDLEERKNAVHVLLGFSGKCVEYLSKPKLYLLWYCIMSFLQNMVVNGFVNSSLATLEKRYELSSLESSFVASVYDIGCLLVVILVSYYGNTANKVKWVGIGGVVMGIGSLIFTSPHFFSGPYNYGSKLLTEIPMCRNTSREENCTLSHSNLRNFKYFFYTGQFVIGIGASPLFPLGLAYIDEIVDKKTSALYIGVCTAVSAVGPAAGYVLFGLFLKIYVDIKIPSSEMTPDNTDIWVGAWWLGFLIAGIAFILFSIPLVLFPRIKILETEIVGKKVLKTSDFQHILKMSKSILTNFTYNCLTISTSFTMIYLTGLSTYGPKYFETMFGFTASLATIVSGIVIVPTFVFGALMGGVINSYYNLKLKKSIVFILITCAVSIPTISAFLLKCNPAKMAGINTNYLSGSSAEKENLYSQCNLKCNCLTSQAYFRPTCGVDDITYYSPCFAGCTEFMNFNKSFYYQHCQCISKTLSVEKGTQLFDKVCKVHICIYFYIFLLIFGLYLFLTAAQGVPHLTSTIRCVETNEVSLSLGYRSIITRCFGSVPGPMIFGYAIDRSCSHWFYRCKIRGNCLKYDNYKYSTSVFLLVIVLTACNAACLTVALYKRIKITKLKKFKQVL